MRHPSLLGNKQPRPSASRGEGTVWYGEHWVPCPVPPSSYPGPGRLPTTVGIYGAPWVAGVTVAAAGMCMLVVWLWQGVWLSRMSLRPEGVSLSQHTGGWA